ncbi:unnamed protein product [Nesidiocoris tenuis]|uniref:Uncharacterized protein n=1 Tax=Nesidiocoris tenuis TaxID=355587 RepID=A0A6H5FU28_9HEMI|nr:unnamed protein product [Nesidiocoris tenuis]CAA9993144.1 unnamed protein product [Nesidiocoris tenuis]
MAEAGELFGGDEKKGEKVKDTAKWTSKDKIKQLKGIIELHDLDSLLKGLKADLFIQTECVLLAAEMGQAAVEGKANFIEKYKQEARLANLERNAYFRELKQLKAEISRVRKINQSLARTDSKSATLAHPFWTWYRRTRTTIFSTAKNPDSSYRTISRRKVPAKRVPLCPKLTPTVGNAELYRNLEKFTRHSTNVRVYVSVAHMVDVINLKMAIALKDMKEFLAKRKERSKNVSHITSHRRQFQERERRHVSNPTAAENYFQSLEALRRLNLFFVVCRLSSLSSSSSSSPSEEFVFSLACTDMRVVALDAFDSSSVDSYSDKAPLPLHSPPAWLRPWTHFTVWTSPCSSQVAELKFEKK